MGSAAGAQKAAAARIGISVEEYRKHLDAGEKWCTGCKEWHELGQFQADRSRTDGRSATCKAGRKERHILAYIPKPRPARGRTFVAARSGDAKQARRRVNYLVEAGLIPHPNTLPCTDCGHVWFDGQLRHEYDHHHGYDAEHHEDVEAVCVGCHHTREMNRRRAA